MIKNRCIPVISSNLKPRIFTNLVLAGILSVSVINTLGQTAIANPVTSNQVDLEKQLNHLESSSDRLTDNYNKHHKKDHKDDKDDKDRKDRKDRDDDDQHQNNGSRLPDSLVDAVLQDTSRRTGIARANLRITGYSRETWPDGCLGLRRSGEICTTVLVPGWRVVVFDGRQNWRYRTDNNGRVLRLENQQNNNSNGENSNLIPTNQLPPALPSNAVFREISSGGITGRTYQTILYTDGRLVRVLLSPNGSTSDRQVRQISAQRVRDFQQLIVNMRLNRFNRVNYPPSRGAADYTTITVTSQYGTTRYADIVQNTLPADLRVAIVAWNQIK